MLVDNVLRAQQRSFSGERQVLVAMAEPQRLADGFPTPEASQR